VKLDIKISPVGTWACAGTGDGNGVAVKQATFAPIQSERLNVFGDAGTPGCVGGIGA